MPPCWVAAPSSLSVIWKPPSPTMTIALASPPRSIDAAIPAHSPYPIVPSRSEDSTTERRVRRSEMEAQSVISPVSTQTTSRAERRGPSILSSSPGWQCECLPLVASERRAACAYAARGQETSSRAPASREPRCLRLRRHARHLARGRRVAARRRVARHVASPRAVGEAPRHRAHVAAQPVPRRRLVPSWRRRGELRQLGHELLARLGRVGDEGVQRAEASRRAEHVGDDLHHRPHLWGGEGAWTRRGLVAEAGPTRALPAARAGHRGAPSGPRRLIN